jgi:heat shock protein HslJ
MSLTLGSLAFVLLVSLPTGEAYADRARQRPALVPTAPGKAKVVAPPPAAASLTLAGTYNLTHINGRTVRNPDLAGSIATFSSNGSVSVQTACNRFGTNLQSRTTPNQILGFGQTIHTAMRCSPPAGEAEFATARLFSNTANIARAGNIITFFDVNGTNIAQWTMARVSPATPEASAPQTGAPPPVRAYSGDFVLSELNGNPVGAPALARPRGVNQLSMTQPTLFLRENASVIGSSGCNQYTTTLVSNRDGTSRFGPVTTTRKACLNRATRTLETAFFRALRTANRVEIGTARLDVYGENGQRTARLSAIGASQ